MSRKVRASLVPLAALLCARLVTSTADCAPHPIETETVHYVSGGESVSGFLAKPTAPGRHPGLIVIHEWWGLVPWVREQARKFAGQGYVSLAVDLYRGPSTTHPEVAHELMQRLPPDRAVRDLVAAFNYLAARPDVDPNKIGSVGWCMGGGYSLLLAVHEPRLAACIVNYGSLPSDPATIAKIRAPVLGNFGGLDRGITPAKIRAFEKAMRAAGKSVNAKIYPDAGHAFENPNNQAGYRPQDARDAWNRMTDFLAKTLR